MIVFGKTPTCVELQVAINSLAITGGEVRLPAGTTVVYESIILPSSVTLVGSGSGATELKLAPNANCDVLISNLFHELTGTGKWFFEDGVPDSFGLIGLQINGNSRENTKGSGICFFGKRYKISDVLIHSCCGSGFYSECGEGIDTAIERSEWHDMPEAIIDSLWIRSCGESGFVYRGPHDGYIDKLFVNSSYCNENTDAVRFEWKKGIYDGACDVNFIHAYAAKGRGIFINAKIKAQYLVGDSCYKEGIYVEEGMGDVQIAMIEAFLSSFDKSCAIKYPNIRLRAPYTTIGVCRVRDERGGGGVVIEGNYVSISNITVDGFSGQDAIGLSVSGRGSSINGLIRSYSGVGGLAVLFKGAENFLHNMSIKIDDCTTGFYFEDEVFGLNLNANIFIHNKSQVSFSGVRVNYLHNSISGYTLGQGNFIDHSKTYLKIN